MTARKTVLILGADGFIGRHIAFHFRACGWRVLAHARNTAKLKAMGFDTLEADLFKPESLTAEFWQSKLETVTHLVNAAGVLSAPHPVYEAVHVIAPNHIYKALPAGTKGVLVSAVGIQTADTDFARYRRAGEGVARENGLNILRAGLVLADTSYGGSSLARALAVLPFRTPVVGDGQQQFNPIHASDLAAMVEHTLSQPTNPEPRDVGGPETLTQAEVLQGLRAWLGLKPQPVLRLPIRLARALGWIGDKMHLGPISAQAVAQLEHGVVAKSDSPLPTNPRGFSQFVNARPAGTQDIWHARLYLARPALRLTLAFLWLASGLLGLLLPSNTFLPMLGHTGLPDGFLIALARLGGLFDIALAAALLRGYRPRLTALAQLALVGGYTFVFSALSPALWLLPLGGLLKNIPILALIAVTLILEEER
ncbi:SDR family oxidoreductase [Lentibacter algarum]|uniref:SDR family oxidoreductase n=1 Tax=Lentibacter algarum TaxID=576131 RepID=UPI001C08BF6A|nr:SDR family oxidoreductase [Lentibacter algarum]MBU2982938.1 SDR family oxidoreductase [Lentibacter algarum]